MLVVLQKSAISSNLYIPDSGFCLRGPNSCELCEMPWAHTFNSYNTVTFNSAIAFGLSQLCALLYLMWSNEIFSESSLHWTAKDLGDCDYSIALQLIFCNINTLLSSLWKCGSYVGKGFYIRHHWVQKWQSLSDHMIWWMNRLVDYCRYYCWAEKLMLRRNWALQKKPAIR